MDSALFDDLVLSINGHLMHPLQPSAPAVIEWERLCGSASARVQIARMGIDAPTAEELFIKYGSHVLATRLSLFEMLYILKNDPAWDNVSWSAHSPKGNQVVWKNFWDCVHFFNQVWMLHTACAH